MKAILVIFLLACGVVLALDAVPDPVINPPNWVGTWTSNSRYGGETYMCQHKNRIYGAYSNAGFFVGETGENIAADENEENIGDREMEGIWFEGGRGNHRNDWQGSFRIKIFDDNQGFDGIWYRLSQLGKPLNRWRETRLGAPYPSSPSSEQCLTPAHQFLTGSFYSNPGYGREPVIYNICRDQWDQMYGSISSPNSYIEGWSVDSGSGFQGYRYDSDGRSGALILRSISDTEVRGYYWRGRLARQNIETAEEIVLTRTSYIQDLKACQSVGPGFQQRLKGPGNLNALRNNSGVLSVSFIIMIALVIFVLF